MPSLEDWLAALEEWLLTHRNDVRIAPVIWNELPEELHVRLNNFARDEAVKRVDTYARDGKLDLSVPDAVGDLVNAMSRVWTLDSIKVLTLVEEYLDELPAPPGREFAKIADKFFRHRASAIWRELKNNLHPDSFPEIVKVTLERFESGDTEVLDRSEFLKRMGIAYSEWTLKHPKEAVSEALSLLDEDNLKDDNLDLTMILDLMKQREAIGWIRALELENEVGVTHVTKDDLIRVLKRFALIVKREGGLSKPKPQSPRFGLEEKSQSKVAEAPRPAPKAPPKPENVVKQEPKVVEEQKKQASDSILDINTKDFNYDDEIEDVSANSDEIAVKDTLLSDIVNENNDDIMSKAEKLSFGETEKSDTDVVENKRSSRVSGDFSLSDEDEKAIGALFGGEDMFSDEVHDTVAEESPAPLTAGEGLIKDGKDKRSIFAQVASMPIDQPEEMDEVEEKPVESDNNSSEEINFMPLDADDSVMSYQEEENDIEDDLLSPGETVDDIFADLREGSLRDKIVTDMYYGDSTALDVFLAKLSGAPDWNRAKQFIANELFRCKVDLHSELGEQFFVTLKRCMGA